MNRFSTIETPLAGLVLLARAKMSDERGYLSRLYDRDTMTDFGWPGGVAQINQTETRKAGTVRGMHFQTAPVADAKLVTCLNGAVMDIVIDIRKGSPTFLNHYATQLSAENARSLLIPPGFAHGFQALEDNVMLIYAHSAPYDSEAERGFNPDDPALAILWPLDISHLSVRDQNHPPMAANFEGFDP